MHAFDRQTDGQTDGQTDRNLIVKTALHSMQRGKNVLTNCVNDNRPMPSTNRPIPIIVASLIITVSQILQGRGAPSHKASPM